LFVVHRTTIGKNMSTASSLRAVARGEQAYRWAQPPPPLPPRDYLPAHVEGGD
jgi:hypothetical protein